MTSPSDLSAALNDVWTALATAPWQTNAPHAEKLLRTANLRLREISLSLDPESWPRDVATYLWRHPDHAS